MPPILDPPCALPSYGLVPAPTSCPRPKLCILTHCPLPSPPSSLTAHRPCRHPHRRGTPRSAGSSGSAARCCFRAKRPRGPCPGAPVPDRPPPTGWSPPYVRSPRRPLAATP
eukprot:scaffold14231_cov79-Isochrysis_galbana.AAC.1